MLTLFLAATMRASLSGELGTPDQKAKPALEPDMAALKLFISHSSRQRDDEASDPLAQHNWQLLKETCAALEEKYGNKIEVLVDYQELYPGVQWEQRLHELLYECHAAIILFSRRAIDESDWVKMEATILHSRARLDREFKLVPVLLAQQTTTKNLETGFFGTLGLSRWQSLPEAETAQDILDCITLILGDPGSLRGDQQSAFQRLLGAVERLLANNLDRESLEDLWSTLFPHTTPPLTHRDPVKRHARALSQHLVNEGEQSLQRFKNVITSLRPRLLRERAEELLKYVRALWVEETAAALIPGARSPNGPCLALNGKLVARALATSRPLTSHFTLNRYLERAWLDTSVSRVIEVLDTTKAPGETTRDVIQRHIRERFRRHDDDSNESMDQRVRRYEQPVALLLQAKYWSNEDWDERLIGALQELKVLYSSLIFVFWIEGEIPNDLRSDVITILPTLEATREDEQYDLEDAAWYQIEETYG